MASNIRRSSSIGRSFLDRDALSPVPVTRRMSSSTPVANSRVQWIFFALGASVLLSWNALITATPYFLSRLDGTGYKSTFSSYLSATYTASNFGFLALATASFEPPSASRTIRRSMFLIIIMLFLLAASPMLPLEGSFFFFFVIFNSMIQASAGSYLQTAVAGLGALFGPQILQYAFTGQAAVGVTVSVVQYISMVVSLRSDNFQAGTSVQNETSKASLSFSAFIFFGIATGYMILSLAAHALLIRMPAYLAIIKPFEQPREVLGEEGPRDNFPDQSENQPFLSGIVDVQFPGKGSVWDVANMNIVYNIAVAYDFVVTLSVFPPITSSILSVHRDSTLGILSPALFVSFHFLTFNVGDWLGRYLCAFPGLLIWSPRRLAICSLLRTLFIPLFLSCNVSRGTQRPSPPSLTAVVTEAAPIINSDLIFFAILLAFGISGGYLSSMCIIAASSLENNNKLQKAQVDTAATVAQFFLIGGLFVGSVMSFGVRATVCNCNPFYE